MEKTLSTREEEINTILYNSSNENIKLGNFDQIETNANVLSIEQNLDRANLSRILNKLCRLGYLIKIQGRPTLFVSKQALNNFYPDIFFPEVLSKDVSIMDFINSSKASNEVTLDPFLKMTGYSENESLYNLINSLKVSVIYANDGFSVLLYGEHSCGKIDIIKNLFEYGLINKAFKGQQDFVLYDCFNLSDETELFSEIAQIQRTQPDLKMVVIKNFDILSEFSINKLKHLLSEKTVFDQSTHQVLKLNMIFVIITEKNYSFIEEKEFHTFIPTILKVPNLNERTIKEKISHIIAFFQDEADNINKTIKINKNIINCFAMSYYSGNFTHLRTEIKNAIASSLKNYTKLRNNYIEITFDHLSDNLLNNVIDVNNNIDELNRIYDLLKINMVFLIPHNSPLELEQLNSYTICNKDKLSYSIKPDSTQKQVINDVLSKRCLKDIKEAQEVKFDTIRSIEIKDIYDLLYEELSKCSITNNDYILYGFLHHFDEVIEELRTKTYHRDYHSDIQQFSLLNGTITKNIMTIIKLNFDIEMPIQEEYYALTYLHLADQIIKEGKVGILVMCELVRASKSYFKFINSLNSNIKCDYVDANYFDFEIKSDECLHMMVDKIKQLDTGKGVLVISDSLIPDSISRDIKSSVTGILFAYKVSIPSLEKIVSLAGDCNVFLDEFANFDETVKSEEFAKNNGLEFDLIKMIQNDMLGNSLVFLNPIKITEVSFEVLYKIINDLHIDYSDILAIRFISHTAYMTERVIRGEKLNRKKMNEFVNTHGSELRVLEQHFQIIEDEFGITIPQSELIYITELFLDFMS